MNMDALIYHPYTEWKFNEEGYKRFEKDMPEHQLHQGKILIVAADARMLCAVPE